MIKEIWKDIRGYNSGYQVSSFGRIRSWKRGAPKIRKLKGNGGGYLQIDLWKDSKQKFFLVHRIVAIHFLDPPEGVEYCQVNHKDKDRSNNHVDNLEWITHGENIRHRDSFAYKRKDFEGDLDNPFGMRRILWLIN